MELRFKLDNPDDITWLKSFPKDKRVEVLQQCVTLGRVILSVQPKLICSPNEFMAPFQNQIEEHLENVKNVINTSNKMAFEPIVGRFDHLCSRIDELTNVTSKSALKGKMGEELIARGIKSVFPEIEISDMSKKEHETDYHLTIPSESHTLRFPTRAEVGSKGGSGDQATRPIVPGTAQDSHPGSGDYHPGSGDYHPGGKIKILLEIKTYNNTVPTSQVEKLYQDITFTGFKYAVMISTTSNIARHKNFDWEIYKDCLIVYIANAGLNGVGAVSAIQFILAIHQFKSMTKSNECNFDTLEIESFATVFGEQLEKYQTHLSQYAKLKYNFTKFESNVSNSLRELFTEILEMESESRRIANELSQTFYQKLLPLTGGSGNFEITEIDKINAFIDNKTHNKECYARVLGYITKFKLNAAIKDESRTSEALRGESELLILHGKKIISRTESTKHTVSLVFDIKKGENYSFTGMEKIRGGQLLIQICKENYDGIEKIFNSRIR